MPSDVLTFLSKYAQNMKASQFPVLTARRRNHVTTDMQIIMLGDSHSWGQGSPGYDVIFPAYSAHMAVPYSKGYYAQLRSHIRSKYDWYPNDRNNGSPLDLLRPVNGIYTKIKREAVEPISAAGFYSPRAADQAAIANLGYLAFNSTFASDLLLLAPERTADGKSGALCYLDMKAHASKVYIGVLAGQCGAKLEVFFHDQDHGERDDHEPGTFRKWNTCGYLYPLAEGFPRVTKIKNGIHIAVSTDEGEITSASVVIDTYLPDGDEEVVYCIDYGQKQLGRLCLAYAGAHPSVRPPKGPEVSLEAPVLRIRGLLFDGNDARNFSMGGHTVGQWLGDGTASFNDPSHPHVEEFLRFVPFTPALAIIQAPIVNEYLRQTPIETFTAHLRTLLDTLNRHHNEEGSRRMDVLLFTTPGDKSIAFEGAASAPISYGDYYGAVKEFASVYGYGYIDFEHYFRDCFASGVLDYEFLFDDPIHPSPYVNEFIAKKLAEWADLVM